MIQASQKALNPLVAARLLVSAGVMPPENTLRERMKGRPAMEAPCVQASASRSFSTDRSWLFRMRRTQTRSRVSTSLDKRMQQGSCSWSSRFVAP